MISGWLTNKGKVIECEVYEHFKADNEIIQNVWEEYEQELKSISDDCNSLDEQGEHPEWHNYEMAESDYQHEALHRLYKLGFLRLGHFGTRIAVAGYPQWIEQHKYALKKLADKYECELNIIKEKYE